MQHRHSVSLSRQSRTDLPIREEAEPCELHERLHCPQCKRSKEESLNGVLKRSISTNAVNTIKRKTSVSNLHRTLSQTSCYSTGTTQSVPTGLQEESFNEFLNYISGNDKYDKSDNLWDILPKETKEVFIKRVLTKKKKLNNEQLAYSDLKALLMAKDKSNKDLYNLKPSRSKSQTRSKVSSQREQLLSEIIGQIFDEVSVQETQKGRYGKDNISPAWLTINNDENVQVNNLKNSEQMDLLLESNSAMEKIRLWRDRQEINDKINELNHLIERYEQFSPLATPSSTNGKDKKLNTPRNIKSNELNHIPSPSIANPVGNTAIHKNNSSGGSNSTIFDIFASKSKKFIGRFRHKKKSSQFELYRKPHPEIRTLIDSEKTPH
ncbi:hypothetical protein MOSE0_F03246 [Monosporozyma servazzii]